MELIVIVEFFALIYVALPENETSKIITGQKNKPKTKYQKPTVNYVLLYESKNITYDVDGVRILTCLAA